LYCNRRHMCPYARAQVADHGLTPWAHTITGSHQPHGDMGRMAWAMVCHEGDAAPGMQPPSCGMCGAALPSCRSTVRSVDSASPSVRVVATRGLPYDPRPPPPSRAHRPHAMPTPWDRPSLDELRDASARQLRSDCRPRRMHVDSPCARRIALLPCSLARLQVARRQQRQWWRGSSSKGAKERSSGTPAYASAARAKSRMCHSARRPVARARAASGRQRTWRWRHPPRGPCACVS